jgi:hypothetical protein
VLDIAAVHVTQQKSGETHALRRRVRSTRSPLCPDVVEVVIPGRLTVLLEIHK